MNRREAVRLFEAVRLLTALPMVKSIEVASVSPRDVIVIESEKILSQSASENLKAFVKRIWPDNKCVVLCDGLKLRIAREV